MSRDVCRNSPRRKEERCGLGSRKGICRGTEVYMVEKPSLEPSSPEGSLSANCDFRNIQE
jgi:hypothetical protein